MRWSRPGSPRSVPNDAAAMPLAVKSSDAGHSFSSEGFQAVVKNTFIDIVSEGSEEKTSLRKTASDGDLSNVSSSCSSKSAVNVVYSLQAQKTARDAPDGLPTDPSQSATQVHCASGQRASSENSHPTCSADSADSASSCSRFDATVGCGPSERPNPELEVPEDVLKSLGHPEIINQIPREKNGQLTSLGSIGHAAGDCSPCLFWYRKICMKGYLCDFCHFKHKGKKPKRLRPGRRMRAFLKANEAANDDGDIDGEGIPSRRMPKGAPFAQRGAAPWPGSQCSATSSIECSVSGNRLVYL
mmetsp:Transcript_101702/g.286739  ORF Transcript_101702/g.286739 Transcript_101702/m.286739 type:complete len:300 (-) Transcript_101702:395-1294(-)